MNGCFFSKKQIRTVKGQIAVNLVRRNLMIALDSILAAGIHQHLGSHDIGLEENSRILNGTVHMGLCCEIDNNVRMLLLKQLLHSGSVCNICLDKPEIRVLHSCLQRGEVACIGELVQADDSVLRMLLQL